MDFISRLTVKMTARAVGQDEFGNRYYESKRADHLGKRKRYVLYKGIVEASKIPPGWYGWLHYTDANPPPAEGHPKRRWQRPHQPNLTGTAFAYKPSGHLMKTGKRPPATGDYEPWRPDGILLKGGEGDES